MKTSDFYYELPQELIAQTPLKERDSSRMLVLHRSGAELEDKRFSDIVDYLNAGDCLVINRTRVIPARLIGERIDEEGKRGGKIEFLLLKRISGNLWETLVKPGRRAKIGRKFVFGDELIAEVVDISEDGSRIVEFSYEGIWEEILDRLGEMPLPPYISEKLQDKERYQTVYAKDDGSAAAPTAGLHFTPELMDALQEKGVRIESILLHVGLGTFRPVKADDIKDHHMHSEYYEIDEGAAERINDARKNGGRIVCVGTTSCRTLESASDEDGFLSAAKGWTDIFIRPGYSFKCVDALITNFHLPESTLLMLISALAGRDKIIEAYGHAVKERYRFFSFGDAMLID